MTILSSEEMSRILAAKEKRILELQEEKRLLRLAVQMLLEGVDSSALILVLAADKAKEIMRVVK